LILDDPNLEPRFGQFESLVSDVTLTIGSSSVIFACGAARLGLKVAFIGVVGNDLFGRFMLEQMSGCGIDVSAVIVDPAIKTGTSVILNRRQDRAILTHLGAIASLGAEQIPNRMLEQSRHLHIASYFLQTRLQKGLPSLLAEAKKAGCTISLDTNWDPAETWSGLEQLLPLTDIFLPNEQEAKSITGLTSAEEAMQLLAKRVPCLAVKRGGEGASAFRGKSRSNCEILPVTVVDTVGAGDSFDSGFIYGFLNGWSLEDTLKLAVVCGSLSTRQSGGTAAQPTLEEAKAGMLAVKGIVAGL